MLKLIEKSSIHNENDLEERLNKESNNKMSRYNDSSVNSMDTGLGSMGKTSSESSNSNKSHDVYSSKVDDSNNQKATATTADDEDQLKLFGKETSHQIFEHSYDSFESCFSSELGGALKNKLSSVSTITVIESNNSRESNHLFEKIIESQDSTEKSCNTQTDMITNHPSSKHIDIYDSIDESESTLACSDDIVDILNRSSDFNGTSFFCVQVPVFNLTQYLYIFNFKDENYTNSKTSKNHQ